MFTGQFCWFLALCPHASCASNKARRQDDEEWLEDWYVFFFIFSGYPPDKTAVASLFVYKLKQPSLFCFCHGLIPTSSNTNLLIVTLSLAEDWEEELADEAGVPPEIAASFVWLTDANQFPA